MKPRSRLLIPIVVLGVVGILATVLAKAHQAPASETQDLIKQARKANSEGKQDEALALYRQSLEKNPNQYEAYVGIGAVLDLKGQYDDARKQFAKAIDLAPADSKAIPMRNMAFSYAFQRQPAEAAKYEQPLFDEAVSKQNYAGAAETANELARIYLESGDLDNAYKWYETGFDNAFKEPKMKDADKDLWNFRWEHAQARIAARRSQCSEAQKHVAAAKTIIDKGTQPDQVPFFPYLTGYVAYYCGDTKTAIADLQKANQRDPFILVLLAQAYEKSGDKAQATDYYRKVLAINGHNPTNAFARPIAKEKLGGK